MELICHLEFSGQSFNRLWTVSVQAVQYVQNVGHWKKNPKLFERFELLERFERLERGFLSMYRQEGKNFRRVEDVVDRHEIVVGVLEADVPGAVVDRLNAAEIE